MKKSLAKDFELRKVKKNEGGLIVNFAYNFVHGGTSHENVIPLNSTLTPHPDLIKSIDQLKGVVAKIYGLNFGRVVSLVPDFKITKAQAEYLESHYQETLKKIEVTGVCISGKDEKEQVIITAKYKTENGIVAINTKAIKLNGSKYGFEEEVQEICETIKNECYSYVWEDKSAEPTLFKDGESQGEDAVKKNLKQTASAKSA